MADRPGDSTPFPPSSLAMTLLTLPRGSILHRVHRDIYSGTTFNPGLQGNARFSPIRDRLGQAVPTLYGGSTLACAMMETIFHDVPHTSGFKSFAKNKLLDQIHSPLHLTNDIVFADLAAVALRKLGITRKQLIDTEKDQYPATRLWAEAIHHQYPEIQGLSWISRQDDSARAVMLFGDRLPPDTLALQSPPCRLLDEGYDAVLDLAERIGVIIVPGKT